MDAFFPSLAAAGLSSVVTLFVSWVIRRDATARQAAAEIGRVSAETTRVDELTRRVRALETDTVSQRDFVNLTQRLDEIRLDIREIRNGMEMARK
jgi:hypothetical protein